MQNLHQILFQRTKYTGLIPIPLRILCYNADPCQHLLMLLAKDLGYVVQVGDGLSEFCQRLCHIPSFCVIFVETVGHNCFAALLFPLHLKGFFLKL